MSNPQKELLKLRDLEMRLERARRQAEASIARREHELDMALDQSQQAMTRQQAWINLGQQDLKKARQECDQLRQAIQNYQREYETAQRESEAAQRQITEIEREIESAHRHVEEKGGGLRAAAVLAQAQPRLAQVKQRERQAQLRAQKALENTQRTIQALAQATQRQAWVQQRLEKLQKQWQTSVQQQRILEQSAQQYRSAMSQVRANLEKRVPAARVWLKERQAALEEFERATSGQSQSTPRTVSSVSSANVAVESSPSKLPNSSTQKVTSQSAERDRVAKTLNWSAKDGTDMHQIYEQAIEEAIEDTDKYLTVQSEVSNIDTLIEYRDRDSHKAFILDYKTDNMEAWTPAYAQQMGDKYGAQVGGYLKTYKQLENPTDVSGHIVVAGRLPESAAAWNSFVSTAHEHDVNVRSAGDGSVASMITTVQEILIEYGIPL